MKLKHIMPKLSRLPKREYRYILPIIMTLVFALAGCATDKKIAAPKPIHMLVAEQHEEKNLSKEYVFPCNVRGIGKLTLLPGVYVKVAEDDNGTYWMNRIIRSGNIGIKDRGGVFIPNDKDKLCEAWMVPQNMTLMLGPTTTTNLNHDQKKTVIYLGDIPVDVADEILAEFK